MNVKSTSHTGGMSVKNCLPLLCLRWTILGVREIPSCTQPPKGDGWLRFRRRQTYVSMRENPGLMGSFLRLFISTFLLSLDMESWISPRWKGLSSLGCTGDRELWIGYSYDLVYFFQTSIFSFVSVLTRSWHWYLMKKRQSRGWVQRNRGI